jgi:predicted acylesterase/phospholipase RssA
VRGERLVDGALVEPVPVDAARDLANLVIAGRGHRPHNRLGMTAMFQALHIPEHARREPGARAEVLIRMSLVAG